MTTSYCPFKGWETPQALLKGKEGLLKLKQKRRFALQISRAWTQLLGQRCVLLCSWPEPGQNGAELKRNALVQWHRGFQHHFLITEVQTHFLPV